MVTARKRSHLHALCRPYCALMFDMCVLSAHRRMRTVTNYFLVNLSVADLLMAVFNCIFNFVYMLNRSVYHPFFAQHLIPNDNITHHIKVNEKHCFNFVNEFFVKNLISADEKLFPNDSNWYIRTNIMCCFPPSKFFCLKFMTQTFFRETAQL